MWDVSLTESIALFIFSGKKGSAAIGWVLSIELGLGTETTVVNVNDSK